jgi:hypothetical protein
MRKPAWVLVALFITMPSMAAVLEPLYRSMKAVEVSTTVGVTLMQLREFIQKAAVEISIAKDNAATKKERDIVRLYESAIAPYLDSLELLNARMKLMSEDGIPCSGDTLGIADKYSLPCLSWKGTTMIPYESPQYLWRVGSGKIAHANSIYFGKASKDNKINLDALMDSIYRPLNEKILAYKIRKEAVTKDALAYNQALKKQEEELTTTLKSLANYFTKPCEAECNSGKWYWKDPFSNIEHSGYDDDILAAEGFAMDARVRARYSHDEKWRTLLALAIEVQNTDDVVCIPDGAAIYHEKNCELLTANTSFLCIKRSDVPSSYRKCPICDKESEIHGD